MSAIIRKAQAIPIVRWLLVSLLFLFGGYIIGTMALEPANIRLMIFSALMLCMVAFQMRHPRIVLFGLLLYLPFVTFLRRLLIPVAGWNSFDPLIVLAPLSILLMGFDWVYRTYIVREPIQDDTRLFRLVRWLLLIHTIQVFNPLQGSILVGFGGIMFYVVPLFWMILSRKYFDESRMKIIFATIMGIGVISAIYGLKQSFYGFYDFDLAWVNIAGYSALIVGTGSRAFSFFTSSAEYAQYMMICMVIAWGFILRGKWHAKLISLSVLPLFMFALFMTGSRGPIVMSAIVLAVMSVVKVKKFMPRLLVAILALSVLVVLYSGMTKLNTESNAVVAHQVNGLTDPMDEQHSTLGVHIDMAMNGFVQGLSFPIGRGLGSTTLAGAKLGNSGENAEMDFSNIMVSDGILGGIVYLLLIFNVLRLAFIVQSNSALSLAVFGILFVTAGAWSYGGNYSTCAIIWVTIGYLDAAMKNHRSNQLGKEIVSHE